MNLSKDGHVLNIKKDLCLFTARDIFILLANIDELAGHKIRLRENLDGSLQIQVNQTVYTIWDEIEFYKEHTTYEKVN